MTIEVRRLRWWHLDQIVPLEREIFGPTAWSAATWWSELAQGPNRCYWVAIRGAEVLGYAGRTVAEGVVEVQTIAVASAVQGQGLGTLLLTTLINSAAADPQTDRVSLEVAADNEPALALYERFGFSLVRRRPRYYQPGDRDALVLDLPVH